MTTVATVGTIKGISDELVAEWTITQYSTLSRKVDDYYHSPVFSCLGNRYYLRIYCNGDSEHESDGYTGLYLMVEEMRYPFSFNFTLSLKNASGGIEYSRNGTLMPDEECGEGFPKFFKNSKIALRSNAIFPKDVLTVRCSLMNRRFDKTSLLNRLLNVSRTMIDILKSKKRTDVVIKVEGEEIQAHRVILEERSEFFQKMLSHDMLENRTGVIEIGDMKAEVFQQVLAYMYGGTADVTTENASSLYVAADKFNLEELKALCLEFMKENITDDMFCDAYVVAETYDETDLMRILKKYIGEHSTSIIATERWKKFAKEDPVRSLEIMTTFVKILADKGKSE